jgi:hypothetical protein
MQCILQWRPVVYQARVLRGSLRTAEAIRAGTRGFLGFASAVLLGGRRSSIEVVGLAWVRVRRVLPSEQEILQRLQNYGVLRASFSETHFTYAT